MDSISRPIGSTKETSMSKIKKIKVIIKNRKEKGVRDFFMGVNPHSKGVIFSRSFIDFSLIRRVNLAIRNEIIMATEIIIDNDNIKNLINK